MKVKTCSTATDTCSRKPILQLLCPLKGSNRNQTKMLILVNRTNHFQHLIKPLQVTAITSFRYLVPSTEGEGRNIVLVRIPSALASWLFIVCTLFPEPIGGVWPNLHRHIIGGGGRNDYILVTLTSFSRSYKHFEIFKFWPKKLVCTLLYIVTLV